MKRVVIIQGHPDPKGSHFCHALADAYARGAEAAGIDLTQLVVAQLDFPLLRTKEDWETGAVPPDIQRAQQAVLRADHLVIIWPLWLGAMPAILKAFLEQVFRPGLAGIKNAPGKMAWQSVLKGKTARIVVTMGMPALIYRWYFGAHSLKSLERNILRFSGIGRIHETIIGMVEAGGPKRHTRLLEKLERYGRQGR